MGPVCAGGAELFANGGRRLIGAPARGARDRTRRLRDSALVASLSMPTERCDERVMGWGSKGGSEVGPGGGAARLLLDPGRLNRIDVAKLKVLLPPKSQGQALEAPMAFW